MQRHEAFITSRLAEYRGKALQGQELLDEPLVKNDERDIAPGLESEFLMGRRRRLAGRPIGPFRLAQRRIVVERLPIGHAAALAFEATTMRGAGIVSAWRSLRP
jgi:hypothetical protein